MCPVWGDYRGQGCTEEGEVEEMGKREDGYYSLQYVEEIRIRDWSYVARRNLWFGLWQ